LDANICPSYAVLTRFSAYPSNEGKASSGEGLNLFRT
jgi:hypothetical protein